MPKTRPYIFEKCYETNVLKQQKGMKGEDVVNGRTLSIAGFFHSIFVGHVDYLTISGKVGIFDFGRPQKWFSIPSSCRKCLQAASTPKCPGVFDFLKFGPVYNEP